MPRQRVHLTPTRIIDGDIPPRRTGYGMWVSVIEQLLARPGSMMEIRWPGQVHLLRHGLAMAARRAGRAVSVRQIDHNLWGVKLSRSNRKRMATRRHRRNGTR